MPCIISQSQICILVATKITQNSAEPRWKYIPFAFDPCLFVLCALPPQVPNSFFSVFSSFLQYFFFLFYSSFAFRSSCLLNVFSRWKRTTLTTTPSRTSLLYLTSFIFLSPRLCPFLVLPAGVVHMPSCITQSSPWFERKHHRKCKIFQYGHLPCATPPSFYLGTERHL